MQNYRGPNPLAEEVALEEDLPVGAPNDVGGEVGGHSPSCGLEIVSAVSEPPCSASLA